MNDISIHVKDRWDTDTLTIDLDYRTDVFTEEEISQMFKRFLIILEVAVSQPDQLIGKLLYFHQMNKRNCCNYLREKRLKNQL
ncbi:condensation domain-containing protein [Bacillus sp. SL00103]